MMPPKKLTGIATHYRGMGRQLGYPTANISTQTDLADGVYFGYANLDHFEHQPALIFVGTPTTVGDTVRRVEAHLLDIPDRDYYGLSLELEIWDHYRSNQTFESIDELVVAMKADEAAARGWFKGRV